MAAQPKVLQQLVDDEDLDGLFALVTLDEVAIAWCSYTDRDHGPAQAADDDPEWWAIELFYTTEIFRRSATYRALLLKLVEHGSDWALGCVGAGPLENFVSDNEGDLQWLERECAVNPKLRTALSGVACSTFVSPQNMDRLDAAAQVPLARHSS